MKRLLVTGNAGSGKSTLARRIASQRGLPCHSLDRVVWQSGWKKTPQAEKAQRIHELMETDSWMIDGVSLEVQTQADAVVFLDVPRRFFFSGASANGTGGISFARGLNFHPAALRY